MDFTREEIFIIKACKNHFKNKSKDNEVGSGYESALAIIQHLIYGNPRRYFETELKVLKDILLKSRKWTVEKWAGFETRMLMDARNNTNFFQTGKLLVDTREAFEKSLINQYLMRVHEMVIQIKVGPNEWKEVIDLNITKEEEKKVQEAIQK